ncbi:thermonuclease family protein [Candidatus Pacearchaeota archaeon]|nr:thermonuclease family protein [Candidatus Pacearchaeota archaeon]
MNQKFPNTAGLCPGSVGNFREFLYFFLLLIIFSTFIVSAKNKNEFLVTKIIDGDTIEIESGQRIRLICINTPEKGEGGYKEAKDYLKSTILNKKVVLKKDISETDRHDRLLRYLYLNNKLINELIARKGYGVTFPYEPDTKFCAKIKKAEKKAKKEHIGLWQN